MTMTQQEIRELVAQLVEENEERDRIAERAKI